MMRHCTAPFALVGSLAFCMACSETAVEPGTAQSSPESSREAPFSHEEHALWPTREGAPGLVPGTHVTVCETRRVEGIETERSRVRVRWTEVDGAGRGIRAELVVQSEERGQGDVLRSTPNEGLRFAIAERSGKLRLLSGTEPHFTDETDRQPALFARVIASGGWNALKPDEPKRIGDAWSVPLGRYLEEADLAGTLKFEGKVSARRIEDRRDGIAIAFDVALQTPERFQQDVSVVLRGEAVFHPHLAIAVRKHSTGVLRRESASHGIEVETIVDEIVEGH